MLASPTGNAPSCWAAPADAHAPRAVRVESQAPRPCNAVLWMGAACTAPLIDQESTTQPHWPAWTWVCLDFGGSAPHLLEHESAYESGNTYMDMDRGIWTWT